MMPINGTGGAPDAAAILVVAKAPVAGQVKTRLCPPCTPTEAALLADAALQDTFEAILATPCARRFVALEGERDQWIPEGFTVFPQVRGELDRRLAAATVHVAGPVLVVGMDTPQLTASILRGAFEALNATDTDAVFGPASDGGYWCIGLRAPTADVFDGIPMSRTDTGALQMRRLVELGLRVSLLEELTDVDTFADALTVGELIPESRFARVLQSVNVRLRDCAPTP